jgi:endonuclease/exonuclease/phosphatase family metal-dependent hydrolase
MKTIQITLLIFFSISNVFAQSQSAMTYNIRYASPNDGKNSWDNRKTELVDLIQYYEPKFLGIQEALHHQLQYIDSNLTNYSYGGVGRDDGGHKGEFCAIFYDSSKFELKLDFTFWLSENSDSIAKGWDAALPRICTMALFESKTNGQYIWIFNTHFDHRGKIARKESAKLILEKIKYFNTENYPVILMGDFNALPEHKPIQILSKTMSDAFTSSEKKPYGPIGTFNGFKIDEVIKHRIDYVFTTNLKVLSFRHIDDKRQNNLQVSDHLPVLIEFEIE